MPRDLIEPYWNVKEEVKMEAPAPEKGFNRTILECKASQNGSILADAGAI